LQVRWQDAKSVFSKKGLLTIKGLTVRVFLNDCPDMNDEIPKTSKGVFELPVHFIKSNFFRVVHAGGAWFGGDGHGNLHLTFFNERTAIPESVKLSMDEKGNVLGETYRESKTGIVRELEVDIVFTFNDAVAFYQALGENIKSIQETQKQPSEEKVKTFKETITS
jgi:hypothetical protein